MMHPIPQTVAAGPPVNIYSIRNSDHIDHVASHQVFKQKQDATRRDYRWLGILTIPREKTDMLHQRLVLLYPSLIYSFASVFFHTATCPREGQRR